MSYIAVVPAERYTLGMHNSQEPACSFCERLVSGRSDAPWDTTVAQTSEYTIVPTKGALVAGWLLVVSKRHVLCAGALDTGEFGDLQHAICVAKEIVERSFGPATVFEHGPRLTGTSLGCGIDHLHFHVAPLKFRLSEAVDSIFRGVTWKEVADIRFLGALHRKGIGYAMIHEPGSKMVWFPPRPGIRQPLRRAIASRLGVPESFDYASYPHLPNVVRTLAQIAAEV